MSSRRPHWPSCRGGRPRQPGVPGRAVPEPGVPGRAVPEPGVPKPGVPERAGPGPVAAGYAIPERPELLVPLRSWQREAYDTYFLVPRRDFLLVATPGAGKTACALTIAAELLARREIMAITVVTPTEHLKYQWAAAAHRMGIALDPAYRNAQGRASADFVGIAVTYAQVAAHPALHRQRTQARPTLVIFDEIHHAGDAMSWGEAVREAFEPAKRRLAMTGTPFRSDANPIPFVTYQLDGDGARRSSSDYVYGYGPALGDAVVRPVIFLAYSGQMRWQTRAGDELSGALGEPMTNDLMAQAWRTALNPKGEWIARVIEAADRRLSEVRKGMPDAAGLVIAGDHEDARAYAAVIRKLTGERPVVVLSDDRTASRKIAAFTDSADKWMVAVRMVSEGVDIPRLAVGVYATSVSTALYFAQAVGRFIRARRRGETASVFLPSIPVLLGYAADLEAERDHVLRPRSGEEDEERALAEAQQRRDHADSLDEAAVPGAGVDRALRPGPVRRRRVRRLTRRRGLHRPAWPARPRAGGDAAEAAPCGADQQATARRTPASPRRRALALGRRIPQPRTPPAGTRETLTALRKELNGLVAAWHHRTGQPHGAIHAELRRNCGGPALAQATAVQVRDRIDAIRRWAAAR